MSWKLLLPVFAPLRCSSAVLEKSDEAAFQLALRDAAEAQQVPLPKTPLQWSDVTNLLGALGIQLRLNLKRAA